VRSSAARALTRPLRREIARALPERPFALRFWDGTVLPATADGAPEFHARTPAALTHFLRSPGELGLGRAYVQGDLAADDLDVGFEVVDGCTRIWRLYLRAARRGFDVGFTSVYQVLAYRP
jgi:hypothetical protein